MNHLDIRKYTSTYMENTPVAPWIINPNTIERLEQNAAFIKFQKSRYSKDNKDWHLKTYMTALRDFDPNSRSSLSEYGIKTKKYSEGGKTNREDFDRLYNESKLSLSAERFFGPDFLCQGSSRHALLYDLQLKGVGANHLNFSQDFHHRWGGFLTRDALRAIFNNEIINARTPLGASEILGLFIYENKTFNHITECIQVRDASSYRLAQLYPGTNFIQDKKVAKSFLEQKFNGKNSNEILQIILSHYVNSFKNGVQYRSITYDNLLLDGVFTDSESVDFTADKTQVPRFIKIFVPSKVQTKKEPLKKYFDNHDCYLFSSWAHDLRKMYHMSTYIYDDIFSRDHYDNDLFLGSIENLADEPSSLDILNYNSYRETILLPPRQSEMKKLSQKDLSPFMDYNLIDHFELSLLEGTVLTFCKDRDEDLRHETVQTQNKLEVLVHTEFDKLSLNKAFDNYKILQKSVGRYI